MDAGVEATQERLPDVLSKNPATAHGLVGRSPASAEEGGLSRQRGRDTRQRAQLVRWRTVLPRYW